MSIMIKKINAITLGSLPVWYEYIAFQGASVGTLLLLLLTPFSLNKWGTKEPRYEKMWFAAILIIGFIGYILNSSSSWFTPSIYFNNHFPLFLFFIPLIVMCRNIDIHVFIKTIYFISVLACLICIYQRIIYFMSGSFPNYFFIPFLELNRSAESMSQTRPSAFFSEPAHFAYFMIPVFYLTLLQKKTKFSLLFALGILFSEATTGILGLPMVLLWHFFSEKVKLSHILLMVIVFLVFFCVMNFFIPQGMEYISRKLDPEHAENDSRLLLSLQYISYLELHNLVFGVGQGQLESMISRSGFNGNVTNFAPMFICATLYYGIVGLIVFVVYFVKLWKKYVMERGFWFIVILLAMTNQFIFGNQLLYLMTFIMLSDRFCSYTNNEKKIRV